MVTQPWTPEQRAAKKRKIDKEAQRLAERLGALGAYTIVFFPAGDGEHVHIIDGGKTPMPVKELLEKMLTATVLLAESGGKDVSLQ